MSTLRFSLKVALSALIALYASRVIGLEAPYWAGISAVVVSGGSFGGSYISGLNRAIATLLGLAVGLIFIAIMGPSIATSGLAIMAGAIICEVLRLEGGMKLGAGTTLIPTMIAPNSPIMSSFERAGNVLLGCFIGVVVNLLLWPEKAMVKLGETLRRNVGSIGTLLNKVLKSYALDTVDEDIVELSRKLKEEHADKAALLKEIVYEPEPGTAHRAELQRLSAVTRSMAEQMAAILGILEHTHGDSMRFLMKEEFLRTADAIEKAAQAYVDGGNSPAYSDAVTTLQQADDELEDAFEAIRRKALTYNYPTKEVLRFTSILYLARTVVQNFEELRENTP